MNAKVGDIRTTAEVAAAQPVNIFSHLMVFFRDPSRPSRFN
jgi:hypothetical protein